MRSLQISTHVTTTRKLLGLVNKETTTALLEQAMQDLPKWYYGDDNWRGLEGKIAEAQRTLAEVEQHPLEAG